VSLALSIKTLIANPITTSGHRYPLNTQLRLSCSMSVVFTRDAPSPALRKTPPAILS
jgi:hypothetical protein